MMNLGNESGITAVETHESGLAGRLFKVFLAPSAAFSHLGVPRWSDWLVPGLLSALTTMVFILVTQPIISKTQHAVVRMQLEKNPNLSADQREQIMQNMASVENTGIMITIVSAPFAVFAFMFVLALVCFLVANVMMGAHVTYLQMLAVAGYSYIIGIPEAIVKIPLILAKDSMAVYIGLGVFLTEEIATQTFIGQLAAGVDLFGIWQLIIVSIGIAIIGRISLVKSLVIMFILWAIWMAGKAALSNFMHTFNLFG